jgi:CheY-like chemotaxis protein
MAVEALPQSPAGLRVLVVDDNQDAADTMALLLQPLGYEVHVAYEGLGALRAVKSFDPDAVILDIGLPDLDGYAVARRIRQMSARRPVEVIALSGWCRDEDRLRCTRSGIDSHFAKPADPALIVQVLARVAARKNQRTQRVFETDTRQI